MTLLEGSLGLLVVIAVVLVVPGIAVKHLAYILKYGSIFEPLRRSFGLRAERQGSGRFVRLVRDLFACELCLASQTALWLVGLPLVIVARVQLPHVVGQLTGHHAPLLLEWAVALLVGFLLSMAVAAIARLVWLVTELPAERLKLQREYLEEKLEMLEADNQRRLQILQTSSPSDGVPPKSATATIDLSRFMRVIEKIEAACDGEGCGYSRLECRQREATRLIGELANELELPLKSPQRTGFSRMVRKAIKLYFKQRGYSHDEELIHTAHRSLEGLR